MKSESGFKMDLSFVIMNDSTVTIVPLIRSLNALFILKFKLINLDRLQNLNSLLLQLVDSSNSKEYFVMK